MKCDGNVIAEELIALTGRTTTFLVFPGLEQIDRIKSLKKPDERKRKNDMQTFLPYEDYAASAKTLDRQRLGKQRVETLQIARSLAAISTGWKNHPATKMWEGSGIELINYGISICDEWIERGYKDTCKEKLIALTPYFKNETEKPWWLGDQRLHKSHRSSLLRKKPEHYRVFWPEDSDNLPYWWPTELPLEARNQENQ